MSCATVDGRLAAERAEQRGGRQLVDHLRGGHRVERRRAEHHVGERLGEHAADAEHHGRPRTAGRGRARRSARGCPLTIGATSSDTSPSSADAAASRSAAAARTAWSSARRRRTSAALGLVGDAVAVELDDDRAAEGLAQPRRPRRPSCATTLGGDRHAVLGQQLLRAVLRERRRPSAPARRRSGSPWPARGRCCRPVPRSRRTPCAGPGARSTPRPRRPRRRARRGTARGGRRWSTTRPAAAHADRRHEHGVEQRRQGPAVHQPAGLLQVGAGTAGACGSSRGAPLRRSARAAGRSSARRRRRTSATGRRGRGRPRRTARPGRGRMRTGSATSRPRYRRGSAGYGTSAARKKARTWSRRCASARGSSGSMSSRPSRNGASLK